MVFANKQDMDQAMTPTEVANALGLPALKDRKWQIFKTSATKGTGLEEAMEWLVFLNYIQTKEMSLNSLRWTKIGKLICEKRKNNV